MADFGCEREAPAATRTTRICRLVLVASITASAGLTATPAAASAVMSCSAVDIARFTPGISVAGGESRLEIRAEESAMHCDGTVNGHTITGPATYRVTGTARGDCTSGTGVIESWDFAFPTEAGIQRVRARGDFHYLGAQGSYESSAYDGRFVLVPIEGDCLTGVTASVVVLHGTFPTITS